MLRDATAREAGWSRTARIAARMPRLLGRLRRDPGELPIFLFARLPPARAAAARLARLFHPVPVLPPAGPVVAPPAEEVLARLHSDGVATGLRLDDCPSTGISAIPGSCGRRRDVEGYGLKST